MPRKKLAAFVARQTYSQSAILRDRRTKNLLFKPVVVERCVAQNWDKSITQPDKLHREREI
jgi:hypothetical protein